MANMTFKANLLPNTDLGYNLGSSELRWKLNGIDPDEKYVLKSGDTMTGTLIINKTQDASGTADNRPALIIGGDPTSSHIEIDSNEILSKNSDTTSAILWLQDSTGKVEVGGTGGLKIFDITIADDATTDMNKRTIKSSSTLYFDRGAETSLLFLCGGSAKIRIDGSNAFRPEINNTLSVGTSSCKWADMYATNFHGILDGSATSLASLGTIGSSSTNHATALQGWFNNNKATTPRNQLINFYDASNANGSATFGYFLNGYDNNPYGGFFSAHYNTPYYIGIQNGTYTEQVILTNTNYTNYVTKLKNITLDSTTINTEPGTFAFSGSGAPWAGTDWVGLQVGDNVDKFQIHAEDGAHLAYRQNDNGGSNASWGDWHTYVDRAGDTMTGPLYINNTTDVGLNQNGALVIGNKAGYNIGIDNDEIMARNNSAASTLYLNNEGGAVRTGWLQVINNSSNNSNDAMVYLENQNNSDWAQKIVLSTYNYGLFISGTGTNLLKVGDNSTLYIGNGDAQVNGSILKITNNSNTLSIGSQNSTYTHIYNSANIPFIFNKDVNSAGKNWLGSTDYPWGGLRLGGTSPSIQYQGTKANRAMITMIDNTSDGQGNGVRIGGGGLTIIGGGESADTLYSNLGHTGGSEIMVIGSDNTIDFYPGQDSYDASAKLSMSASRFWAGVNGNTAREAQIGVQSGAGQMYMWSAAATTGSRGLYSPAHGSGTARALVTIDTNNRVYFADSYTGTSTALAYSQAGLAASAITWLTCWNGYELRGISKAEMANAVDSAHKWVRIGGDTMTGSLDVNRSTYSDGGSRIRLTSNSIGIGLHVGSGGTNRGVYDWGVNNWLIYCDGTNCRSGLKIYGAVWNDYAEYRETKEEIEPGRCVREVGDGTLILTTERLQAGCEIVSDTFGFAIGQSKRCQTPTAASGRVLAYCLEGQEEARKHIGEPVCSGPNGTVSIMTHEEEKEWPSRIIGTISEIPSYDIWIANDPDGEVKEEIKVNGRIWIRIR